MDTNDRQAIARLFDKLSQVESKTPARDPEAERFIGDAISRQPSAPYYMAQTIVAQEHALNTAQTRIAHLEAELAEARRAPQEGGFLSALFGDGDTARRPLPSARPLPQGSPGGFLAGAAQTAMGVAGGVLLANALVDMFTSAAQAADMPLPDIDDVGFDDGGDW